VDTGLRFASRGLGTTWRFPTSTFLDQRADAILQRTESLVARDHFTQFEGSNSDILISIHRVRNKCARCHSIDKVTASQLKIAPPFRTLHNRYPIETIAEALARSAGAAILIRSVILTQERRSSWRRPSPPKVGELLPCHAACA